jgi:hypothetical protein
MRHGRCSSQTAANAIPPAASRPNRIELGFIGLKSV